MASPPKLHKYSESSVESGRLRCSESPPRRSSSRHRYKSPRRHRRSDSRPEPSSILGVFGLHVRTTEIEIRDIFERYGTVDKVSMVYDVKSSCFRGYCFIYYSNVRDATTALKETNGLKLRERRIRVDFSKTKRAHTPTPGFYKGHWRQRNRSIDRYRSSRRDRSRDRSWYRDDSRDRHMRSRRSYARRRSPSHGYRRRSRSSHGYRRHSPSTYGYRRRSPSSHGYRCRSSSSRESRHRNRS